jgi:hypothetical protein
LVWFCGCTKPVQTSTAPDVPIEGIRIEDVAPSTPSVTPVRIVFRILSFDVASDQYEKVLDTFNKLGGKEITFVNYETFRGNNFNAAFGKSDEWPDVADVLSQIKAQRTTTENLIVYDDRGDDIVSMLVDSGGVVTFLEPNGSEITDEFSPGRFAWVLRARPVASIRGVAQLEMRPVYRLGIDSYISRLARFRDMRPFDGGSFGLKMSAGDFLLLGPGRIDKSAQVNLSTMLFTSPKDPSAARIYMIGCVGVGD